MKKKLSEELNKLIESILGSKLKTITAVSGGCIHQSWKLELEDTQVYFAKTTDLRKVGMLVFEAEGLKVLRHFANNSQITVPKVIAMTQSKTMSILIMPWLHIVSNNQSLLGKGLASLHKNSIKNNPGKFGWQNDGYIGSNPQSAGWIDNWGECFVKLRLLPQLNLASKWGINILENKKLISGLCILLNEHQPEPTIVHGDLWSGNCGMDPEGRGILIDPAVWWADREVDIAMSKLFGGFTEDFYKGYESVFPLSNSSRERIEIYNLYHLLNHANMFGGSYITQCLSVLKNIRLKYLF